VCAGRGPKLKRDVWVDFHRVDENGRLTTYAHNVEPGTDVSVGATVLVGDDDGHRARATVVRRIWWRRPARIVLQIDLSTVEYVGEDDTDDA
jgi:hypothetical protein